MPPSPRSADDPRTAPSPAANRHADEIATPAPPAKPTRFFGSVKLDASRLNRDAAQVSTEIVQHLTALLGAEVEITLEIQAHVEGGIPDHIVRTLSENCKTLKFRDQGFEQD